MEKTIRSFLSGIVDYAGIFPPARLSLEDAMTEYIKYRHSNYDWMLSHFIISASRFDQLKQLSKRNLSFPDPLRLSVTAATSESMDEYLQQLKQIREEIFHLHQDISQNIQTQVLEIKLPDNLTDFSAEETLNLVNNTVQSVSDHPLQPVYTFFEVPGFSYDINQAKKVINAIAVNNKTIQLEKLAQYQFSGFKIRCGGVEAFQFPPSDCLADVMIHARNMGVPIKFTAGLHHPFRKYHDSVETKMHGFINVFGAGILASANGLKVQKVTEILEDENNDHFTIANNQFSWKDIKATLSDIQETRKHSLISFGSCSMAEPVEDLQKLGFIK